MWNYALKRQNVCYFYLSKTAGSIRAKYSKLDKYYVYINININIYTNININ